MSTSVYCLYQVRSPLSKQKQKKHKNTKKQLQKYKNEKRSKSRLYKDNTRSKQYKHIMHVLFVHEQNSITVGRSCKTPIHTVPNRNVTDRTQFKPRLSRREQARPKPLNSLYVVANAVRSNANSRRAGGRLFLLGGSSLSGVYTVCAVGGRSGRSLCLLVVSHSGRLSALGAE